MSTYGTAQQPARSPTAGSVRHFLLHLGEMVLAMAVGMAVFGGLFGAILIAAGTSYDEALGTVPALVALMLMFDMTVPMVLWMRHRGHPRERIAEMACAMLAVGVLAVCLLWASVLESTAICGFECALMIPVMAVVMFARRHEY